MSTNDTRRDPPVATTLWTAEPQPRTRPLVHHHKSNKHPSQFPELPDQQRTTEGANGRVHPLTMNKDAFHTNLHYHRARDADLMEQFCRDRLPSDDIYVPAAHQPVNPEDEDDVVPDQHAAFGIQKATMAKREPAWRDFGLGDLMGKGPEAGVWKGLGRGGAGGGGSGGRRTALPR